VLVRGREEEQARMIKEFLNEVVHLGWQRHERHGCWWFDVIDVEVEVGFTAEVGNDMASTAFAEVGFALTKDLCGDAG
jgi:hypothetical protein